MRKEQLGASPFREGQSGNPAGRPKDARCKLGESFSKTFCIHGKRQARVSIRRSLIPNRKLI
ncbi:MULTISPECIES: DUF5681 domain-containing protein [Brucella]|uniref:DUF5681 domain-containing protein n=1 Tax=Brucella TaxID=234 RepID=UPI0035BC77E6